MKTGYRIALAALLCAGTAAPAIAQGYNDGRGARGYERFDENRFDRFDYIGTVEFDRRGDRERVYGQFGGPVEALRLEARDSAVQCRNVRVTFANGRTRNVFDGRLREDRPVNVDLPGDERNVRSVTFNCRALSPRGSRVAIAADIGNNREAWMRHSDFNRLWRDRFAWGHGPEEGDRWDRDRRNANWVPLGVQRFQGRRDSDASFLGRRGQQIESIAIRPVNADARCRRITATFANGRSRDLNLRQGEYLLQNRLYQIDLPGEERNVERIDMTCQAVREPGVTVEVLASR